MTAAVTGSDLTEREREQAPPLPRERPHESGVQGVDDKGPRERHDGPYGCYGEREDKVEGKVASWRRLERLGEGRDELVAGHG